MATPTWRWRLGCGWVPYQGNRLDGLGLSNDQRGVLVESFAPMRGIMRRPRRRRYRVGAQTVNVTSAGLVASAIVVVMEVIAPSSGPPGAFSFPARADHPSIAHPAPPGGRAAGGRAAAPVRLPGFDAVRIGDRRGAGGAVGVGGVVRERGPDDGRAGSGATLRRDRDGVRAPGQRRRPRLRQRHLCREGKCGRGRCRSPREPQCHRPFRRQRERRQRERRPERGNGSVGNGSVGNGAGANAHGNGESFKSEPSGQAVTDTLVSPVPVSATAASERDPAPGPEATDPLSRGFGPRRPATAGLGAGEGQEGSPAAPPGRSSPRR